MAAAALLAACKLLVQVLPNMLKTRATMPDWRTVLMQIRPVTV
jgi:hypothetical protein